MDKNINKGVNINMYDHVYDVEVIRVIDGDTFVGNVHGHIMDLEITLKNMYFRMLDINAPEKTGKTKEKGLESKAFLEQMILGKVVQVDAHDHDSFGRKLAKVYYEGLDINNEMIVRGYAVPYE